MEVVISGAGVVSGTGSGREGFRRGLRGGHSNRQTVEPEPPVTTRSSEAVRVVDFDPVGTLGKRGLQFLPRVTQMLLVAVVGALGEAKLEIRPEGEEIGVVVGTNFAGLHSIARYDWTVITEGPSFVSPMEAPNTLANAPASHLSIRFSARALNTTVSTGRCATLDALGYAAEVLQLGQGQTILAGGVEEINAHTLWQYGAAGTAAKDVVPGEAATVFVLESADTALGRGAAPLARFGGWSNHLAPLEGPVEVVSEACRSALQRAGVSAEEVSLIGLGVNGDAGSDEALAAGVARLFEGREAGRTLPAFSTKAVTGETYTVAGGLQVAAALDAMQDGLVPPNAGLARGDWPSPIAFPEQAAPWQPGPALIVECDPFAGASAVVLLPFGR